MCYRKGYHGPQTWVRHIPWLCTQCSNTTWVLTCSNFIFSLFYSWRNKTVKSASFWGWSGWFMSRLVQSHFDWQNCGLITVNLATNYWLKAFVPIKRKSTFFFLWKQKCLITLLANYSFIKVPNSFKNHYEPAKRRREKQFYHNYIIGKFYNREVFQNFHLSKVPCRFPHSVLTAQSKLNTCLKLAYIQTRKKTCIFDSENN